MTSNITVAYDMLKGSITQVNVFGISWIIPTIIIVITLVLITRDIQKWKILTLPVSILYYLVGIKTSWVIMFAAAIIFAVESLSIQAIGNIADIIRGKPQRRMVERELKKHQQSIIKKNIKAGLTNWKDIVSGDIYKATQKARGATTLGGHLGRIIPRGYKGESHEPIEGGIGNISIASETDKTKQKRSKIGITNRTAGVTKNNNWLTRNTRAELGLINTTAQLTQKIRERADEHYTGTKKPNRDNAMSQKYYEIKRKLIEQGMSVKEAAIKAYEMNKKK